MDAELPQDILASDSSNDRDEYDSNNECDEIEPEDVQCADGRYKKASNDGSPCVDPGQASESSSMNGSSKRFQGHHRGTVRLSDDDDSRSGNESTTSSSASSSRTSTTSSSQSTSSSSRRRQVVKSAEYFARRNILRYLKKRGFNLYEKTETTIGLDVAIESMKKALETSCSESVVSCGVNYSGSDVLDEVDRFWKFYLQIKSEAPPSSQQIKPMLMPVLVYFFQELLLDGMVSEGVKLFAHFCPKFYGESPTKDNHHLLNLLGKVVCALNFKHHELRKHPVMKYLKQVDFQFSINSWVFERLQKFILESKTSVLPNLFSHRFVIKVRLDGAEPIEEMECEIEIPEHASCKSNSDVTEMLCRLRGALEPNLPSILVYKTNGRAVCGAISKHGSMVAYGVENSGVRIFEAPPKQSGLKSYVKVPSEEIGPDCITKFLNGHNGSVYDVCFHPRAKYIFSAGEDKVMRIWDAHNSVCRAVYRGHHCPIWSVDVSGSGSLVATGSMDTTARIWVPERTDYVRLLVGHYFDVDCVKFHPNEAYVATGSVDKSVRLWSVSDGNLVRVLLGPTGAISCLDFHANGRLLAAGGEDNLIRIWDLGEGNIVAELEGGSRCRSISFYNDMLAAAYANGNIQIWNLQNTLASCYSGEQREEEVTEYNSKTFHSGVNSVLKLYYKNPGLLYCIGSSELTKGVHLLFLMEATMSGMSVTKKNSSDKERTPPQFSSITAYLNYHGYRMGKVIGEGSYSKVRLTTRYFPDGTSAYRLASKVIKKKKASDDFVTKFLPRELQIVARLDHPNIVRVYDVVEFDHHVYIFMDWCDKGDLLEYIKAKGHISENKSRHYFKQLLSAVKYLHSLDLAHRDLKCENVLLQSRDQVRISDFGFARYCRDKSGKRALSNTYCGSAAYAAPEILQGTSYNPKLYDMWSLGCVLFIMLTGHMPYDESNIQRMLTNQLERILTYPSHTENAFSVMAKNLICHLLEPDVTRRATIEQAVNHAWLNADYHPPSAAGAGDITRSVENPTCVRLGGYENVPYEGSIPTPREPLKTCTDKNIGVKSIIHDHDYAKHQAPRA